MDNCFSTLLNDAQFWRFLTDLRIAMAWAKVVCISTRKRGRPLSFTSALIQYNPRHIHPSRPTTTERDPFTFLYTRSRVLIYIHAVAGPCLSVSVYWSFTAVYLYSLPFTLTAFHRAPLGIGKLFHMSTKDTLSHIPLQCSMRRRGHD